jgi:SAM-dependent methyltransferase
MRQIGGFDWVKCLDCLTWRLRTEEVGELGSRWVASAGWPPPEPIIRNHERIIAELERLTSGRQLLDVGAGRGELVAAARRRGWRGVGVEPYQRAVVEARHVFGIDLIDSKWQRGLVGAEAFDAVVLNHVIEHLADPLDALEAAWEALKPNGLLYLAAPNARTIDVLLSRETYLGVFDAPRHRHVFTDESLEQLVRRARFTPIRSERQVSRLFAPILRTRVSTTEALDAVAARNSGDVVRNDRARTRLMTGAPLNRRSIRVKILQMVIRAARVALPGVEVRIYARKVILGKSPLRAGPT